LLSRPMSWWRLDGAFGHEKGKQAFSWLGLLVGFAAMPIMWVLSRRKLRIADALGSRALRADAMEGITCGWLSFAVVVGLMGQLMLGVWWVDSLTSLVIVWLLVKEGREAWKAEEDKDWGRVAAIPPALIGSTS
jgi:divalent metal cation (Fe/Co/Zn/Cd) transporter